jgi:hypothetical protein
MKQTIKLPLSSIYSLIQNMEKMASVPETAKQHEDLLSTLEVLKETFMPLINEFKDCMNMPDIDAMIDSDDVDSEDNGNNGIDWEQRRYELTKAAMQGRVSALDKNFNYSAVMPSIAKDSIKMADIIIKELANN